MTSPISVVTVTIMMMADVLPKMPEARRLNQKVSSQPEPSTHADWFQSIGVLPGSTNGFPKNNKGCL